MLDFSKYWVIIGVVKILCSVVPHSFISIRRGGVPDRGIRIYPILRFIVTKV